MPRILMRLLEITRALPHRRRDRNLSTINNAHISKETKPDVRVRKIKKTDWIIGMLRQDVRQKLGHPSLDGVGITVDQGHDTENGGVALTDGGGVDGRLAVGREVGAFEEAEETFLWRRTERSDCKDWE